MSKKEVRFSKYKLTKWSKNDEKYKKTERQKSKTIDMRDKNIEEELIEKHENLHKNKKELCSQRMAQRDMIIQGLINPYMFENNYLDDLKAQDDYLRPKDSNYKK
tara:strand:+ start:934 stop:1248 length:315 start_codon:yes stop_codon:yes gene_type:complete